MDVIWKSLMDYSDCFTEDMTINEKGDLESVTKEAVLKTLGQLATIRANKKEPQKIVYFDSVEEKIWILSPVKMALFFQQYDLAFQLLDKGYSFNQNDVYAYFEGATISEYLIQPSFIYSTMGYQEVFGEKKIYDQKTKLNEIELLMSDNKIPDRLLECLLGEINTGSYMLLDHYMGWDIVDNPWNDWIDPKWLIHILDVFDNEDFEREVCKYSCIYYESIWYDSMLVGNYSILSQKKRKYYAFFRLQLQLDLAKKYFQTNQIKKLKDLIYSCDLKCVVQEPDAYFASAKGKSAFIEQTEATLKQRKQLYSILSSDHKLNILFQMKLLQELATLMELQESDAGKDHREIIKEKVKEYKEFVKSVFPVIWSDNELQTVYFKALESIGNDSIIAPRRISYRGMKMISLIYELTGKPLRFHHTDIGLDFMEVFLRDRTELNEVINALGKIRWKANSAWKNKKKKDSLHHFLNALINHDNEELYRTCFYTGLLLKIDLFYLMDELIAKEKYENIPFLTAISCME